MEEQTPAVCKSDIVENEHGGTGAGYINSMNAIGASIIWSVNASESGQYTLTLRYANGGSMGRNAEVQINDGANGTHSITFSATPGAWGNWQEVAVNVDLVQGRNVIELTSKSNEGLANIDNLTVSGEATSAGSCDGVLPPTPPPGGNNNSRKSACTTAVEDVYLSSQMVISGDFDGGCKRYIATYGDGSQREGQDPVLRVEGGYVRNVIVGPNGDGIHIRGNTILENISWPDVAEDALTVKSEATVTIRNFEAYEAEDKVFQLNAKTTFTAENCTVVNMGKMFRENGGKCYPVNVSVNNCYLESAVDSIFRSDCGSSVMTLKNSNVVNARVCYDNKFQCSQQ